jgi:hypothetical protein
MRQFEGCLRPYANNLLGDPSKARDKLGCTPVRRRCCA